MQRRSLWQALPVCLAGDEERPSERRLPLSQVPFRAGMKHWKPRELEVLATLRARFLQRTAGAQDYWRSEEELALYDETFAARIGWKIDAVIRDLQRLGWKPASRRLVDWGCGTGIATRRLLAAWPTISEVALHDRSQLAIRFARQRIAGEHP